jgi:O-antigen/teichoic acid export membrane protein
MDPERQHGITEFFVAFKQAISGGLVKQVLAFGSLSLLAALFSIIFHLYASRALGPEQYGELGVLLSLISALLILLSSFYLIINKFVTQYRTRAQDENIKFLIKLTFMDSFLLGFAAFVLCILLSRVFAVFFQIEHSSIIIFFGLLVWVSFLSPVIEGIFKGMQSFAIVGVYKAVESVGRVVLLVLMLALGFGLTGTMLALMLGTGVAIAVCLRPLYKFKNTNSHKIFLSDFYHYAGPVIFTSLLVAILLNIDIVLVKHFFSPQEAGFFAAAGTLAKVLFMISAALGGVMFARVIEATGDGRPTRRYLKDALVYLGIISGIAFLVVVLDASAVTLFLFGPKYQLGAFLPLYVLAIIAFSFTNIFVLYDLARKKYSIMGTLGIGVVALGVMLSLFHATILQVVLIILAVNCALLVAAATHDWSELF